MRTQIIRAVKVVSGIAVLLAATSASAMVIDFTSQAWTTAIGTGKKTVTLGDVTVASVGTPAGNLTFNGGAERTDCQAGQSLHGLACFGDGIGIDDDEITQGMIEKIKVTFANAVDILDVHFLDLFGNEQTGETAVMVEANGVYTTFKALPGNPLALVGPSVAGGYWETGFKRSGVSSLTFLAPNDKFSDFALARIITQDAVVSAPEIDGAHTSLALCLLAGLFAVFRERRIKR